MKARILIAVMAIQIVFAAAVFGQQPIVINDPTAKIETAKTNAADEALIKREVLPKARKYWEKNEACTEEFQIAGEAPGAFTKPKAAQRLVFYQFCQTGNGYGNNGLVLLENGRVIGSYVSEGGWAADLKALPDIDQNGLNEFLLYYSGGMHQGQGGTGVDLMEFNAAAVRGLGWFQADSYGEETGDWSMKVSVKTGKTPLFYREKYLSLANDKWKKSGKLAAFKLGKAYSSFTALQ
jgi:hypothetical protein